MDVSPISSVNYSNAQWPMDLYTDFNPADSWVMSTAPDDSGVSSVDTLPALPQNNLAMLIALDYLNQPFIWANSDNGTTITNFLSLHLASQERDQANNSGNKMQSIQSYLQTNIRKPRNNELTDNFSILA
jgi:hypothetical protein